MQDVELMLVYVCPWSTTLDQHPFQRGDRLYTSKSDVFRFWRLKTVPALKGMYKMYNGRKSICRYSNEAERAMTETCMMISN